MFHNKEPYIYNYLSVCNNINYQHRDPLSSTDCQCYDISCVNGCRQDLTINQLLVILKY